MFFGYNKLYKSTLDDGVLDGSIRRKTDEEIKEQESKKQKKKSKVKEKEVIKEVVINKPYSEMTNEEKLAVLEKERAFLLSINKRENDQSYNDKGAYTKK